MAKITWGEAGLRRFTTGIDRGVLYLQDNAVPWNGLVSVEENPDVGEKHEVYLDGIKVVNASGPEEAALTLSAFYSPPEFDVCDGMGVHELGLQLYHQPRQEFGLSYRTLIGNDINGLDHGYDIHLIYNALATPSGGSYETVSDDADIEPLSWELTTRPVFIDGFAPTAHFKISTHKMSENNRAYFERMLYGTDTSMPHLPSTDELLELLSNTYGVAVYGTSTYA